MSHTIYDKSKRVEQIGFSVNTALLVIHSVLLGIFFLQGVWIMAGINVISVIIYSIGYHHLKENRYSLYLAITHIEIIVHMLCAVVCVGWKFGFELYSFALIPTIYFEFYSRENQKGHIRQTLGFSLGIASFYIMGRVYDHIFGPLYPYLEKNGQLTIVVYIVNVIIAFSFLIYYLTSYSVIVLKSEEALKLAADYDSLTEIYNRRRMLYLLEEIYKQAESEGTVKFMVSILDVDDFKHVNDTYGHDAGDYVLKRVARMLTIFSENSQNTTIVGRWGGEEFLIIQIIDQPFSEEPIKRLEHIKNRVMKHRFIFKKQQINITVTIGAAAYSRDKSIDELIKQADRNLYMGKERGRNKVII